NTSERLRGFHDAHRELGLSVPQANILAPGYSKGHVEACLQERFSSAKTLLQGIFVNSTISLEGVVRWLSQVGLTGSEQPPMGCFDWDPFVYLLGHDIDMVQQDVPAMLDAVFSIIDAGEASQQRIEIPPRLMSSS
ncbi:TPA: LacI family transcriptional regulator, partial [Klebsiella pneumoniae]